MSLRDKVEQGKAEKAAAKEQIQQQEQQSLEAQEATALTEKLNSIVTNRAYILDIKSRATGTKKELRSSKSALKKERANLREIHAESIDEDTQEAAIPKPHELLRNKEYAAEPEVLAYGIAQEKFKLSAAEARKVTVELKQLGIEDPSKLLPGQLEAFLEEREREINAEARTFVLEHPDVNPEAVAQMKEELISSRAAALTEAFADAGESQMYKSFYGNLKANMEREKGKQGSAVPLKEHALQNVLHHTLSSVLGTIDAQEKSPAEKQRVMNVLQMGLKDIDGPLTEIESEAISRALVTNFLEGGNQNWVVSGPGTGMTRFLNELALAKATGAGEPAPEKLKSPDSLSSEASVDMYEKMLDERVNELTTVIRGDKFLERNLQHAVTGLTKNYTELKEYNELPAEKRRLEMRRDEIQRTLEGKGSFSSVSSDSLPGKLEALNRRQESIDAEKNALAETRRQTLGVLAIGSSLSSALHHSVLDAPIELPPHTGSISIDTAKITGVWGDKEYQEALETQRSAKEGAQRLQELVDSLKRASPEKGLLGKMLGKTKEQKTAESALADELNRMPDAKGNVEPGEALAKATQKISELSAKVGEARFDLDAINAKATALKNTLKPIDSTIRLFGSEGFTGTVREYIPALHEKITTEISRIDQKMAALDAEKAASQNEKNELLEQKRELEAEQQEIKRSLEGLAQREERLRAELKRTEFIPK
ncbi:MAG: Large Ala/Glu-rich protein [Parcubacteria group bacterium]|nr:Large Ala/Glu-rich protein [Parcubacteria group bacterium]